MRAILYAIPTLAIIIGGCSVRSAGFSDLTGQSHEFSTSARSAGYSEFESRHGGVVADASEWSRMETLYCELLTIRPELRRYEGGLAILASSDLAAYSFPSGRIYFTRGLCERLVSDDQRLAVLAHESAHILMRDGIGSQSFSAKQNLQREIRADRMAADMLTELGRSPSALVEVLQLTRSAHPKGCCEARLAALKTK